MWGSHSARRRLSYLRRRSRSRVARRAAGETEACGAHDQLLPIGRDGLEKRLRAGWHVPMQQNRAVLVEDTGVHGPGMQIDATVKWVLVGGKAHEVSASPDGPFLLPAYHGGMGRRGPQ